MKLSPEVKVSISGIRGIYPNEFNLEQALGLCLAFASIAGDKTRPIIVGRDMRPGSIEIHQNVVSTLDKNGYEVIDIRLSPLPTTGIATKKFNGCCGINVTASHNPLPWHGLKFLDHRGEFIDSIMLTQVMKAFEDIPNVDLSEIKKHEHQEVSFCDRALDSHLELFPYADYGLKIGIDAVNGSGSIALPKLAKRLGCQVVELACDPSIESPHEFEPNQQNLQWTSAETKKHKLDFTVVTDPDADRLALLLPGGEILSEEYTLAFAVWHMLLMGYEGSVVTNVSTSALVDAVADKFSRKVIRSAVGEHNVISAMRTNGAIVGGEGNGGVIDGTRHYSRDSLSALYHVASLVNKTSKSLSELRDELPNRRMIKEKIDFNLSTDIEDVYKQMQSLLSADSVIKAINTLDGLRIDFDNDDWVHLRPSNTEPIMRLFGESKNVERLKDLFVGIDKILKPPGK